MSTAGIRSNRGDGYQTLVAFDWALDVLSDPDYLWIEIDSADYPVDDVVVGKASGTLICCQCKKNQIDFKTWSIADLADEIEKAAELLAHNALATVRFYSRNQFGLLAKLAEHSTTQADEASYRASLGKELRKIDSALETLLAKNAPSLSTYEFLNRTIFEGTPEIDRMEANLLERLRNMAVNSIAAYNALWRSLDQLGGRMGGGNISTRHRLTKDDLKAILQQAGALLAPIMDIAEVRASFANTSVIGRTWRRDIAGQSIPSAIVNELLAAIETGQRSILLTGQPGSGKTCTMLTLQERLEQHAQSGSNLVPLFIQSREFADLATAGDREAQGLPEHWVEKAARVAESARVVVVIDSLDVLSIGREHNVLRYFLAQMDRLLTLPNITVVAACRDFDRHYDRRISERQWDCELRCQPLEWATEIEPLLSSLGIHTENIDAITRELIRNPRELALYVELAQHGGSFNVVTSQALGQRYLDTIIRADCKLGEPAIQAIETIAGEMLKARSLSVPKQRFAATDDIQRRLHSLNVIRNTVDGKLTFGHQTLLDVLVISGAVRQGVTLNEFIQGLPPVPFVRPSIRSFVAQLANGERREFRKQLRTVLTGDSAFHIRRLVAESYAELPPHDEDWPLIRDLRNKYREIFQAIYMNAKSIQWHHFWFAHLLPFLKENRDAEGMTAHVYRASLWENEDTAGVLSLWQEALSLEWLDKPRIADQLCSYLIDLQPENLPPAAPLVRKLLTFPIPEHSFLGKVIARCLNAGILEDDSLWCYIVSNVGPEGVDKYILRNKLRCLPHEFKSGDRSFVLERMHQSVELLNLALESIERWSQMRSAQYPEPRTGFHNQFLHDSSYEDGHSQVDDRHADSERVLLNAMETAILHHAETDSEWWRGNREHLCFNREGALRYFAILACTAYPEANLGVIGRMLCDAQLLESSLSYELGTLMQRAFIYLNEPTQDAVMAAIRTLWNAQDGADVTEQERSWVRREQAELIVTIPPHLRTAEVQAILADHEKVAGTLVRQPDIGLRSGWVAPPFSYEVFLNGSDDGMIRLLSHYSGYVRDFDDFLVGGREAVGQQLREAASRHPDRFIDLLASRWSDIPKGFRDEVMDGVATYLAYRHGNLSTSSPWAPLHEADAPSLATRILDELERHPAHWQRNRAASNALQSCSHVITDMQNAERLVFLAIGYAHMREESPIHGDAINLIGIGINMKVGHATEALMILANSFLEKTSPLPELLPHALRLFAANGHPAIRALILRRLSYLQYKNPELGWELFQIAMQDANGLWEIAEPCLYHAYRDDFDKVAPALMRIRNEGQRDGGYETWGRISALATFSHRVDFTALLDDLERLDSTDAWRGAASVWTHPENIRQHRKQCLLGIAVGLNAHDSHALAVAHKVEHLFNDDSAPISIPIELLQRCFDVFLRDEENKHHRLFRFHEWLNAISQRDPDLALAATEIYLAYIRQAQPYYLYDHENSLTQLLTRLFTEAEEREESDNAEMLKRVVMLQDSLLAMNLNNINEWLKAAERPD